MCEQLLLGHFANMCAHGDVCNNMNGIGQMPLMGEFLQRGYGVTVFCPSSPKYKNALLQWGLGAVRVVYYEMPPSTERKSMMDSVLDTLWQGGPLAKLSKPIFPTIVADYSKRARPLALVADFFATSAIDAGDYLKVPTIALFPNPLGMTSLVAPQLRGFLDVPHVWACWLGEAILARIFLWFRNQERSRRVLAYRLPPLTEQDLYPTLSMQRPILATTALGFEYAFPQSPLLQFMGPSPPCNALTRAPQQTDPELFAWLEQQEAVVYVAFGTQHHFTEASVNALLEQLQCISSSPQTQALLGKRVSILWSLPTDQQALLHSPAQASAEQLNTANIRLESFVPQWDVLTSSRVVVFVSHCGANSLYESLLNGIPIVCCPGKADQPANAARVHSAQAGVVSRHGVHSVEAALMDVFGAIDSYTERAGRIRDLFLCQGGPATGADFVERIISCGVERLIPHTCYNERYSCSMWAFFLVGMTVSFLLLRDM